MTSLCCCSPVAEKGQVQCYTLEQRAVAGATLGWRLSKRGELNAVAEGQPQPDYGQPGAR